MFATFEHVVMKIFMFIWVRMSPNSWRGFPYPRGESVVRFDGPDPHRIVLCGSGIVIGYGVTSHELALGGSIARTLAAATKRGAELTTVTAPGTTLTNVRSKLSKELLTDVDIVILSFGTFEILSLLPPTRWGKQLEKLVQAVLHDATPHTKVFIVDCNTPKMSTFITSYQRRIAKTSGAYNEQIAAVSRSHDRVHRIIFNPEAEDPENIEGRSRYQEWAASLVPGITAHLPADGAVE